MVVARLPRKDPPFPCSGASSESQGGVVLHSATLSANCCACLLFGFCALRFCGCACVWCRWVSVCLGQDGSEPSAPDVALRYLQMLLLILELGFSGFVFDCVYRYGVCVCLCACVFGQADSPHPRLRGQSSRSSFL